MIISRIIISDDLIDFLEKRNLDKQYRKATLNLQNGNTSTVNLKLKKPKKDLIYSFRINKQFRAVCKFQGTTLRIVDIDNHQN